MLVLMNLISIGWNDHLPSSFDAQAPPPVPDYGDQGNWAALPGRPDAANVVPEPEEGGVAPSQVR